MKRTQTHKLTPTMQWLQRHGLCNQIHQIGAGTNKFAKIVVRALHTKCPHTAPTAHQSPLLTEVRRTPDSTRHSPQVKKFRGQPSPKHGGLQRNFAQHNKSSRTEFPVPLRTSARPLPATTHADPAPPARKPQPHTQLPTSRPFPGMPVDEPGFPGPQPLHPPRIRTSLLLLLLLQHTTQSQTPSS